MPFFVHLNANTFNPTDNAFRDASDPDLEHRRTKFPKREAEYSSVYMSRISVDRILQEILAACQDSGAAAC